MWGRGLYYINLNKSQLNTKYFILSITHPRDTSIGISSYITQPQTITYNTSMSLTSSLIDCQRNFKFFFNWQGQFSSQQFVSLGFIAKLPKIQQKEKGA